jgi:calcineurin-like phosphoesterase family protein
MTIYFTSDLHIGHRLVANLRGYRTTFGDIFDHEVADVEAHSAAVAAGWMNVKSDDIVWILGDLCVSGKWWNNALSFLARLPGRKRLVAGNHDPVSSIHRDAWKYQREALNVFETVQDFAKIRVGGGTVLLSHYPYSGTGSEGVTDHGQPRSVERYTEFRLTDVGIPLLHGHTHGHERLHFSDAGTPQVHVGLDAWGMKLVSDLEVGRLLDVAADSVKVES